MLDSITDPFVILILSTALLVIIFTIFVNFARGLAIAGLSIGLVFFIFFASDTKKKELNKRAENIISSIKKSKYVLDAGNSIESNIITISNKTYQGK